MNSKRKLITEPNRLLNHHQQKSEVAKQEILKYKQKLLIPQEISTAEYLEALEHARTIAKSQGEEDIEGILQAVLRTRVQEKRKFEKATAKQRVTRGSSQREAEPPR